MSSPTNIVPWLSWKRLLLGALGGSTVLIYVIVRNRRRPVTPGDEVAATKKTTRDAILDLVRPATANVLHASVFAITGSVHFVQLQCIHALRGGILYIVALALPYIDDRWDMSEKIRRSFPAIGSATKVGTFLSSSLKAATAFYLASVVRDDIVPFIGVLVICNVPLCLDCLWLGNRRRGLLSGLVRAYLLQEAPRLVDSMKRQRRNMLRLLRKKKELVLNDLSRHGEKIPLVVFVSAIAGSLARDASLYALRGFRSEGTVLLLAGLQQLGFDIEAIVACAMEAFVEDVVGSIASSESTITTITHMLGGRDVVTRNEAREFFGSVAESVLGAFVVSAETALFDEHKIAHFVSKAVEHSEAVDAGIERALSFVP